MRPAPVPLHVAFGLAVRQIREARGISQETLGHETGLHRNHLGQIERAEVNPTLATIEIIARALSMQPDELVAAAQELQARNPAPPP